MGAAAGACEVFDWGVNGVVACFAIEDVSAAASAPFIRSRRVWP